METQQLVLRLADILAEDDVQARVALDYGVIERYCDDLRNGAKFPPLQVVAEDTVNWLWDGWHRLAAYRACGVLETVCEVRQGTKADAVFLAAGANAFHGMPRTRQDKERSVLQLLASDQWRFLTSSQIAEAAKVSIGFAEKVRNEFDPVVWRLGKDGKMHRSEKANRAVQKILGIDPEPTDDEAAAVIDAPKLSDTYKRPVPSHLLDVFEQGNELTEAIDGIRRAATKIAYLGSHPELDFLEVACQLRKAANELEAQNVAAVCPACDGRPVDGDCGACSDRGWVSKEAAPQLSPELRQRMQSFLTAAA